MAASSSILVWKIPWMGLQSMGSQSQTQLSDWAHIDILLNVASLGRKGWVLSNIFLYSLTNKDMLDIYLNVYSSCAFLK